MVRTDLGVSVLPMVEGCAIDPGIMGKIFDDLGDDSAEERICQLLEDIAMAMQVARAEHLSFGLDRLVETAGRISDMAEQLGLVGLSSCAMSVAECAAAKDGIALSAVMARMVRVGESALREVWGTRLKLL